MLTINFYPRSRQTIAHIDESGAVHLCISEWDKVLAQFSVDDWEPRSSFKKNPQRVIDKIKSNGGERYKMPDYPTNGTTNKPASDA